MNDHFAVPTLLIDALEAKNDRRGFQIIKGEGAGELDALE